MRQTLLAILFVCIAPAAGAQTYPAKPVRVVVPFAAGGGYDVLARVIGQKLSEMWGQPVVVENRMGANGIIGTDYVAKSAPDGYTIMMGGVGPHGINPSVYPKLPYDPVRDFAPIIHVLSATNILVVRPSFEARSVKELIALARSKPGQLSYASAGSGSTFHLAGEMLKTMEGIDLTHVPYKGSAPGAAAVLAGEVSMMFAGMDDAIRHIQAGKLRALAVTSARRIARLPDVPTMVEAGVPGYVVYAWFGMFAPADTPPEIVAKLNRDIGRILQIPDVRERISPQGSGEIVGGSAEQFGSLVRAEIAKWSNVVKQSGAKVE